MAVFFIRKWKNRQDRRRLAIEELNEEFDDEPILDEDKYYTEEEIDQKISKDDMIPMGMAICQNCQTLNPQENKQCRVCAENLD